jgi:plasmid stability protein
MMANLLIRDLTPELLNSLDIRASALGLSRVEYVRRTLAQSLSTSTESVTEQHLSKLLELLPDLADEKFMEQAWR